MNISESPILIFLRSMVLLAVLIALPGIAICWNHIPQRLRSNQEVPSELVKAGPIRTGNITAPDLVQTVEPASAEVEIPIVDRSVHDQPITLPANARSAKDLQHYESLELRLKALGTRYYRLEKWGNRGELFRFSCFVGPAGRGQYEKYFQCIGSDEIAVMEAVLADIEQWKSTGSAEQQSAMPIRL